MNELKQIFPDAENLAPIALQWILSHKTVSTIIPGASKEAHVLSNLSAVEKPTLSEDQIEKMNAIYNKNLKAQVHQKW